MSEISLFLERQCREVPVPCKPVPAEQVDLTVFLDLDFHKVISSQISLRTIEHILQMFVKAYK